MQFNILAEGLSAPPGAPVPFPDPAIKASECGGFDEVEPKERVFDWSLRRLRLLEEITRWSADVVALEECDHYADWFEPALRAAGYDSVYLPKVDAPGLNFGFYSCGTALFWKRDVFVADAVHSRYVDGGQRPFVMATLGLRSAEGVRVTVAATHLKAKAGAKNEERRVHDVREILGALEAEAAASRAPCHVLLMGDFNTNPYDEPGKHEAAAVPAVLAHPLQLRSAYPLPQSEGGQGWTTWKRRAGKEARNTIDYIFHSAGLAPTRLLAAPDKAELEPARLPGLRYPSDHLAIMAELQCAAPSDGVGRV